MKRLLWNARFNRSIAKRHLQINLEVHSHIHKRPFVDVTEVPHQRLQTFLQANPDVARHSTTMYARANENQAAELCSLRNCSFPYVLSSASADTTKVEREKAA